MASLTRVTLQRSTSSSTRAFFTSTSGATAANAVSRQQRRLFKRGIRLEGNNAQLRRGYAKTPSSNGGKHGESQPNVDSSTSANSSASDSSPPAPPPPLQIKPTRQKFASLDFSPAEADPSSTDGTSNKLLTDGTSSAGAAGAGGGVAGGKRTGARSARDSLSSIERRRRRTGWASAVGLVGVLVGGWVWLGWEEGENQEHGVWAWVARSNRNTLKLFDLFDKPIWEKLLPDPLPEGYQRPYTLILSIDDLIVTSTWDRQNGWRTAKRPGVDYFLSYLSQFYEIVIFTTQTSNTSGPIIEALDPFNFSIMYHLFREATRMHNGTLMKDLSYLNRDLSKVIAIDTVPDRYQLQPDNLIEVGKWKAGKKGVGEKEDGDGGLVALIPFLESIAIFGVPDVRPVLSHYRGKDVAREWAKVEAENKARFIEEWKAKQAQTGGLASGGWTLGKLLGNTPKTPQVPQTLLEIRRAEAQAMYKREQEFYNQNKEELQRQKEKAQEEGMKAMMEGGMFGVLSRMGLGPPPPAPAPGSSTAPSTQESSSATAPTGGKGTAAAEKA